MENIRDSFAIYSDQPELIYLDSAATSLTPDCVVDAMSDYYKYYRATVHRTSYGNGVKADAKYSEARERIANFLNAEESEIIFSKGTTAAINSLARVLVSKLEAGDEIITSEFSHHSNLLPWREYRKDITLKYANIYNNSITLEGIKEVVTPKTKIIALHHVSNVMGDTAPIKEIAKYCNENNITFVVDGAQGITHETVDVKDIGMDYYVFSGHKIYGPTGIGVLYGKKELLKDMIFDYGGDMAYKVSKDEFIATELPVALEAGTPSIAEVIGLGEAIKFAQEIDVNKVHNHGLELKRYALELLKDVEGFECHNAEIETGIITFSLTGHLVTLHDAIESYNKFGICMRSGHMCNLLTMAYLDKPGVLRVSINVYNTKADIEKFVEATKEVIKDPMLWMWS